MIHHSILRQLVSVMTDTFCRYRRICNPFIVISLALLFLTACSGLGGDSTPSATPTAAPVNVFGTAANHEHSLLALPGNVLVLATHFGLFRSADSGKSWKIVAAGPNQIMDGLMTFSLVASKLDQQRLYVVTQTRYSTHKGTIGLYTSADQGQSWKLSSASSALGGTIFLAQAGNTTPNEVFAYVPGLGASGLRVSLDAGEHFSATGALPFGSLQGLMPIPGEPGHILAYSVEGMARSEDDGAHWQVLASLTSAILSMTTSGPGKPIYAAGDAGLYSSLDGGKSFSIINHTANYGGLISSPVQPALLYGKTAREIYRSTDGGLTWNALPPISGNLGNLAPDPTNAALLYLSFSYPTKVYSFDQQSAQWSSLTPGS